MDAAIIDLAALGAAATPLADWWESFCDAGRADIASLDTARKQLAGMCDLPGRLGAAVRLVVGAPSDAPPGEFTDAVQLLAATARRCPVVRATSQGSLVRPRSPAKAERESRASNHL